MPSSAETTSGALGLLPPRGTLPAVTLQSRWWDRLGFRLLALVVAAATLPTLLLGLLVIRSGRGSHEREVLARNREVARWGVEKVESFVGNALENIRLLINTGDLDRLDPREARPALSLFLSFMEDVKEITLLDARGREHVRLSEGTLYTSRDLGSRAGSPAFQAARRSEVYIGPVTTSPHAEPFVTLALPVQNLVEGRVEGVLIAELNLKGLWEEVLSFQVGKSGYLYLVNNGGILIAHPDFSLVLAGKEMRDVPAVRRFLSEGEDLPPGGTEGYPNYLGQEVLGVSARSAKLGWGVIVEQPLAEALANVRETKVATTVMLLNTLLLAILLGSLAARYVTRPMRELAAGAATVGAGDFSHTIPIRGRDELAEVAATFNWMTANLRQSFEGLRTLLESTTRLAGAAQREEVLRLAVDETPAVVGNVRCTVLLLEAGWNGEGQACATIWRPGGETADVTLVLQPGEDHPVARALSSRDVVAARAGALSLPTEAGDSEAPALVVPLLAGRQPRGALLVVRSDGSRDFGETEVMLCRAVANHLSIALQLREAHEHLVRAEKLRAVGEIAAGVAHNFNNVLGAILARAELLETLADSAEVRRGLAIIERAALDGAGIVRRLQDSARLRAATPFAPVALNQVVQDALELTRPRWKDAAELRGTPIVLETALGELPTILGNAAELREVVTNIILNAVEAMPNGGRLHVEMAARGAWVTLTFIDTGTGMSDDVRRRIFDPFFTTKGAQGTGLGMSVSYAIVKRHGGEILVDSAVGHGTTVRLRLPVAQTPVTPPPAAARGPAPCASCRILVVDDDTYVRGVLSDVLASLGHRVQAVDSGQQALERFAPEAFDLVMTDLSMELSGYEVVRAIKARSPNTPVILVTGWAADLDEAQLRQAGVDLVLAKPFQVSEVREVVAKVNERRAGRTR